MELTQRTGGRDGKVQLDGHVRITLQGMPTSSERDDVDDTDVLSTQRRRRRRADSLTVVFDAKFGMQGEVRESRKNKVILAR